MLAIKPNIMENINGVRIRLMATKHKIIERESDLEQNKQKMISGSCQ
jgi:hypothetical protein